MKNGNSTRDKEVLLLLQALDAETARADEAEKHADRWRIEAERYAINDSFWREKSEAAEDKLERVTAEANHDPYPENLKSVIMPENTEGQRQFIAGYRAAMVGIKRALADEAPQSHAAKQ